ncbi:hypothetical protein Tco_0838187 [Tanacetum coccineum]|uniref:Uncharacterized protein n=1 Tax=Tanacetum coccineum TaxID=301880 RepID=A0ABQ5AM18_9ASTR
MSNHEQPTLSHPKSDVRNTTEEQTNPSKDSHKYEYEKGRKKSCQDRHDMNTRARKGEKAPCSRDSKAEDGVHPRTPIAVRKAQGIRKITLRAKIVKVGTGSLNREEKSPVVEDV